MHQLSMDASTIETEDKYCKEDMRKLLRQMEESANNISNLCNQKELNDMKEEVTISLNKVQDIIVSVKETLLTSHNNDTSNGSSNTSENNTVIENIDRKYVSEDSCASPSRSNLKSCPFVRNSLVPKSVRFDCD